MCPVNMCKPKKFLNWFLIKCVTTSTFLYENSFVHKFYMEQCLPAMPLWQPIFLSNSIIFFAFVWEDFMPNHFVQLSFQFDSLQISFSSNRALSLLTRIMLYIIQSLNESDAFERKQTMLNIKRAQATYWTSQETFIWCPMCNAIQIDKHKLIPRRRKKYKKITMFCIFNKSESHHLNISAEPNHFMITPLLSHSADCFFSSN